MSDEIPERRIYWTRFYSKWQLSIVQTGLVAQKIVQIRQFQGTLRCKTEPRHCPFLPERGSHSAERAELWFTTHAEADANRSLMPADNQLQLTRFAESAES
jgi:hypothetical protein